ncbi:MAG: ATP-binding cassette domain-containing protein [Veillonellaceae bacterium]|nr:ATP-binding cassette domain-containing protein [Veillonellaceae bacterium]
MKDSIITVEGLTHCYGKIVAVNNIYFNVYEGQIFSFLGPNGAGKTTTINLLITLLQIQKGKVTIAGLDVASNPGAIRKNIGVVFQDHRLDRDLTIWETLEFHGRIHSIPKDVRRQRIDELLSIVELAERRNEFVKNLSGGMKRCVEIARGLLVRPKVLFLDEPTIGLDTKARRKIWCYIKQINREENVTVFLTTHYMDEADQYSDEICIIDKGKIMANGTSLNLKNSLGNDFFRMKTTDDLKAAQMLAFLPEVNHVENFSDGICLYLKNDLSASKIIETLQAADIRLNNLNLLKPTLDDVFIHYTGRGINSSGVDL